MRDVEQELPTGLRIRVAGRPGPMPGWIGQWVRLMVEWRKLLQRYSEVAGDEGWCWSERASVGFLTSAAWNVGGVSLQEYGTTKQGYQDRRRRYKGAGDLWLSFEGHTFAVEAKHKELRIDTGRGREVMVQTFDRAGWDSLRDTQDVDHRVGIAFLPLLVDSERMGKLQEYKQNHIETTVANEDIYFDRRMRVDLFPTWRHKVQNERGLHYVGKTVLIGIDDV